MKSILPQLAGKRKGLRVGLIAAFAAAGTAVAALLISCASMKNLVIVPPDVPGAQFVSDSECAVCHEKQAKMAKFTAHARINLNKGDEEKESDGNAGCQACHGPGSLHIKADDKDKPKFIVNPLKKSDACFRCHVEKEAQFRLPYSHPVLAGKVTCVDCHDPHGENIMKSADAKIARGVNDTCAKCHKMQTAPRVFAHEALREGCTVCHDVHGSINKKMLVENDLNLCLKCHAQQQPSSGTVYIGTSNHAGGRVQQNNQCWTAGCHNGIHGSNINSHLRY